MRGRAFGLSIVALLASVAAAAAQSYPAQRVTIVVPFTAGSITDGLARILADKLGELWKQQVIVENKPGIPGTTSVAKAAPDGYTLMLTSNGHTIASAITKSLQFDPVKDFAGVTPGGVGAAGRDRSAGFAGKDAQGVRRSREAEAGHAQFLLGRRCQHVFSVRRDLQAAGQDQHRRTSHSAARRRRRRRWFAATCRCISRRSQPPLS